MFDMPLSYLPDLEAGETSSFRCLQPDGDTGRIDAYGATVER